MTTLPNPYAFTLPTGARWNATGTVYNDDGTLANLTGKTFELVLRDELGTNGVVVASITTTGNTYGQLVVDTTASTVQIVLNPNAVAAILHGQAYYTLWMDPNLPDAEPLASGIFQTQTIAQP